MPAHRCTRRQALQGAGAALAGVALLGPRMALAGVTGSGGTFKKCIDITPNGVRQPGSLQDYLWLRAQDWWEELLIDTHCLRLWVDRSYLQGDATNYALGSAPAGSFEAFRLLNLDAQIRAANADGLEVILLPYRYPLAANGTLSLPVENRLFEAEDRGSGNAYLTWYYDRTRTAPTMKDLHYRLPPDGHGPDSQWGRYVGAMFERWVARADVHGRADVIDVCNEPNGQLWPQRGPAADTSTLEARFEVTPAPPYRVNLPPTSQMTVHKAVAEMMQTVDEYARAYSPRVRCFAPSTADTDVTANGSYRVTSKFASTPYSATPADGFCERLLDELDRIGFKGGDHWCWSFHNYNDWERREDRAAALRPLLAGRWRGEADDTGPLLAATEGGCRLGRVPVRFPGVTGREQLDRHSQIVSEGIQRFADDFGVGAGVSLLTQYTVCADTGFDDGLRDQFGGERPAWRAWCLPFDRIGP
jgi:hypothetical protein